MEQRTLRSKKLRARLYYSQNGQCAMCGCELPDTWHADHIIPHSVSHRTNVHEMQALCPLCNLKKGTKMLRKHQLDMQRIARKIRSQGETKNILVDVTPGGGKSALPMILAKELAEPMGYKICWVVPRDALRAQGEHDFVDAKKRTDFGHKSEMRASGNDINPSRGKAGYITTYQSIAKNPELHAHEFRAHKYILFLDECHHIPHKGQSDDNEAKYYEAIRPLVELAEIRIFASGTLERHDDNKIAFLPYGRNTNAEIIDWSPRNGWEFIRYSRKDALEESAIVPLHFHIMDGRAKWLDIKTGEIRDIDSIADAPLKDQAKALRTVLETEYAYQLLDKCVSAWREYKDYIYPSARMLVVSPNITVAGDYCKYLKKQGLNTLIATSEDSDEAKDNIDSYKAGKVDILVTVGMAYEGLDVPQITHVACLTNIRSKPWIEQCICRANRTDKDGGKTHGYIYYPDEPKMKDIIGKIAANLPAAIVIFPPKPAVHRNGSSEITQDPISPFRSEVTDTQDMGLEDGTLVSRDEAPWYESMKKKLGIFGVSNVQLKQLVVAANTDFTLAPSKPNWGSNTLTASEREERLRSTLDKSIKSIAKGDVDLIIDIKTKCKIKFGAVNSMTESTLREALLWLRDTYGGAL